MPSAQQWIVFIFHLISLIIFPPRFFLRKRRAAFQKKFCVNEAADVPKVPIDRNVITTISISSHNTAEGFYRAPQALSHGWGSSGALLVSVYTDEKHTVFYLAGTRYSFIMKVASG